MKPSILNFLPEEMTEAMHLPQRYRSMQIFKNIWNREFTTFEEMTDIPAALREKLLADFTIFDATIDLEQIDPEDGTAKLRIKLSDGNFIEAVLLNDGADRQTACISTQCGCSMGCAFCKTGTMGLIRDLTAGEIAQQYLMLKKRFGDISNIVFMGMGEALDNFDNFVKAVKLISHPDGQNMSKRRMTVSTCGIADKIIPLMEELPNIRLAISINTANEEKREKLMPISRRYSLRDLKDVLLSEENSEDKRITLEYVMLKDVNMFTEDVKDLSIFARGINCNINVIPWNKAEGLDFEEPSEKDIQNFIRQLELTGLNVSRRYRKGTKISGACGQLATSGNNPN